MATKQARQESIDAFVEQRVDDDHVELSAKTLLSMANEHDEYTIEIDDLDGERALVVESPVESPYVRLVDEDDRIPIQATRVDKSRTGVTQYLQ